MMGLGGDETTMPSAVASAGVMATAYTSSPTGHLQKVIGPDGRAVWVVR
jgi:hypothetical protein